MTKPPAAPSATLTPHAAAAALAPADAARALANAVMEAGEIARDMAVRGFRTWTKGGDSPVTDADLAVDAHLRERLLGLAPDYGWHSEESLVAAPAATRRAWVVDPIDGTRSYIARRPDWVIAAALVEDGRPLAAALYAPMTEELFTAVAGGGATRNGMALRISAAQSITGIRIAGPRPAIERLAQSGLAVEPVPRIHSLALRFARVASGEIDAALASAKSHDWDLAAADLLVHEAGGLLTTSEGARLVYDRPDAEHGALAAAGNGLHGKLISLLAAAAGETKDRNAERAKGD